MQKCIENLLILKGIKGMGMKKKKGVTIVEILIIAAIIVIVATLLREPIKTGASEILTIVLDKIKAWFSAV